MVAEQIKPALVIRAKPRRLHCVGLMYQPIGVKGVVKLKKMTKKTLVYKVVCDYHMDIHRTE